MFVGVAIPGGVTFVNSHNDFSFPLTQIFSCIGFDRTTGVPEW